jgi:hypothetical protein
MSAETAPEAVKPELVKAQTSLARLHFENWLTFLSFLRTQFERMGSRPTSAVDGERSSQVQGPVPQLTAHK